MLDLLHLCGINLEFLRELYDKEKSVKRVAKRLGVSRPTATKWLRIAGVKTLGHRPNIPPTTSMVGEYSVVSKWIRSNPGKKLPRSANEAAALIGCTKSAVWNYFYRRKKRILRYIASFGDLRQLPLVFETPEGKRIKASFIDSYKVDFKSKTYRIKVGLAVRGASFTCTYPLKTFLGMLRGCRTETQSLPTP